ncbi:MAG: S8 family peptidase [Saprospiraceae bacterium]|nr:S8 family peptidase [Saprospiraceae bacterium]
MRLKSCFFAGVALVLGTSINAQTKAPDNWFNLDPTENNINGVSTEKMYAELLKGKKGQTVVVAVIDGGVDYMHEDLKDIMWRNPREIPNNGIDDDKNGYIDDVYGWNFLGGKDGRNVNQETLEVTRLYAKWKSKYDAADSNKLSKAEKAEYDQYQKAKKEVEAKLQEGQEALAEYQGMKTTYSSALNAVEGALAGKAITKANVEAIKAGTDQNLIIGKNILNKLISLGKDVSSFKAIHEELIEPLQEGIDYYETKVKYQYNPEFNPRAEIIKDNYSNSYERNYGNNDIKGPDAMHGTHVAGIIGAVRTNNTGMKGVADNVRIMGVRCVPDGDERDKDVANSIIYAVDNGATVINMSFGKSQAWDKEAVDKAVKYAQSKDVLLVHAAGNDSKDNDAGDNNFPNARYKKKGLFSPKKAKNWIEVGALSWKKNEDAVAEFSNFGQNNVDVFAPGVDIYSTLPENKYKNLSGTSMASPVCAGVAAVIRSYFPELTAEQVKECIEKSVVKQNYKVKKPGTEDKVPFSSLSRTGGVVNVYNAVKLASEMKGKKKNVPRA